MGYTQEEQNAILDRIMSGVIGTRKQGTWDTMAKKTGQSKFTKESVIEESKQYRFYDDFKVKSNGAFQYAVKYNFIDELNLERKFVTTRNLESIKKEAEQYSTRWEFQQKDYKNYSKALREGWLDEVCADMENKQHSYTLDECKQISSQYSGRTKWSKKHQNSYVQARRNGWLDECIPNKKTCGRVPKEWSYDECKEISLKYDKRSLMKKAYQKAYHTSNRYGWLDEFYPKK